MFAFIAALACFSFTSTVSLPAQPAHGGAIESDLDSTSLNSADSQNDDDKDKGDRDDDKDRHHHKHKHKHHKECEDKDRDDKDRDRDRDDDDKDRDRDRDHDKEAHNRHHHHDRDHDRDKDRDDDRDRDRDDDDDDDCPVPPPILSCLPSSSLSVLIQGSNVTSYVPNGSWSQPVTGIHLVPLEGGVARASIATPNVVNSCSSNSTTGETVCTANNTDVYTLTGSTLGATLSSGAVGTMAFSGGPCANCGVAIDSGTNQAVLTVAVGGGNGGFQFLNLATNAFAAPIAAGGTTSEDISVDPIRHLVLSANENGNYQILRTQPTPALFDFTVAGTTEVDSSAEDCTTGIALASDETTGHIFLADLTQAVFTPGAPRGTWTAPSQLQNFPEFAAGLQFGVTGIAVAPGSHLGIVTGEFAGSPGFGVIQLPATSGAGIPAVVDWAAANMPIDPNNNPWTMGRDPHTVTAYVSPTTHKAMGVIADESRNFIALVDLQALLGALRTAGTHNVDPGVVLSPGIVTFVSIP
jgi:hypothetical protein